MQPEAERSHRRFQPKLLTLWVFISNCKQQCVKHSASGTAGGTALGRAASALQRGGGCNGDVPGGGDKGGAPPAPYCCLRFLPAGCRLLMIKHIFGVPLFKAVVKLAALTCFLQRNRWSLDLRHSHWAGCKFSLGSFEIFLFHCRISD